jgi:hypothetical protein
MVSVITVVAFVAFLGYMAKTRNGEPEPADAAVA